MVTVDSLLTTRLTEAVSFRFMNIIRLIGQFTPFVLPSLEKFEQKAPQSTIFSRLPYLSFFENWLKYPVLLLGRLIVGLLITVWLASLTLQPAYQNFVQQQIDSQMPSLSLQISQNNNTGNLWDDFWNNTSGTVQNAQQVLEREFWRNTVNLVLSSEAFVIFRGLVILLLYSSLFLLFGNDINSIEKKALRLQSSLGNLAKLFLLKMKDKADYLATNQLVHPQEYQQISRLIARGLGNKQNLSKQEVDYLANFNFK